MRRLPFRYAIYSGLHMPIFWEQVVPDISVQEVASCSRNIGAHGSVLKVVKLIFLTKTIHENSGDGFKGAPF